MHVGWCTIKFAGFNRSSKPTLIQMLSDTIQAFYNHNGDFAIGTTALDIQTGWKCRPFAAGNAGSEWTSHDFNLNLVNAEDDKFRYPYFVFMIGSETRHEVVEVHNFIMTMRDIMIHCGKLKFQDGPIWEVYPDLAKLLNCCIEAKFGNEDSTKRMVHMFDGEKVLNEVFKNGQDPEPPFLDVVEKHWEEAMMHLTLSGEVQDEEQQS